MFRNGKIESSELPAVREHLEIKHTRDQLKDRNEWLESEGSKKMEDNHILKKGNPQPHTRICRTEGFRHGYPYYPDPVIPSICLHEINRPMLDVGIYAPQGAEIFRRNESARHVIVASAETRSLDDGADQVVCPDLLVYTSCGKLDALRPHRISYHHVHPRHGDYDVACRAEE